MNNKKKKPVFSLSTKIFAALFLGIGTGVFWGEMVGFLDIVGEVYIKLLQMTVLPYVILSLILGLGRLDYRQAVLLARKGGLLLLLVWSITIGVVFLFPLSFPDWKSSSFFSQALVQPKQNIDFIKLYIPSNPFHAIANNMVPAVVLFCISIGLALIGIKNKQRLMEDMDILMEALTRVTNFVVRLTPLGVFAITASATGTMSLGELEQMAVYLFTYVAFSLALALWILPALVTILTPLSYRQVIGLTRDALVTAFATASLFIVLPILMERCKQMIAEHVENRDQADSAVEVIVPASFNFPHAGKLFTFSFIFFAGWYSGFPVQVADYPALIGSGLMSLFAGVTVAVPFMLDIMHIPSDTFQFFVATSVVNARFGTLLAAVHVLALTLLTAFAMNGQIRVQWRSMIRYVMLSCCLLLVVIFGSRLFLTSVIGDHYNKDSMISSMSLSQPRLLGKVYKEPPPPLKLDPLRTRLEQIREREMMRVCYYGESNMPFSYFNSRGELVGLDIELVQILGEDCNTRIEFVPIPNTLDLSPYFNSGYCDMGIGTGLSPDMSPIQDYSLPYLKLTLAFLVKDYRRHEFNNPERIRREDLLVAIDESDPYYLNMFHSLLPRADLLFIDSYETFFGHYSDRADALVTLAEKGAAWSLLHPDYTVTTPFGEKIRFPLAFPVPLGEESLADLLKNWITLKQQDGTITDLYDYWILGRQEEAIAPRWSVVRDVLHWVD